METPIYDFVNEYIQKKSVRFHMPGHKGREYLGCEIADITEITGADVLSEADGIIRASQDQASSLFGTGATFYSTEGSSQCIKAMLSVVLLAWKGIRQGQHQECRPWILAARNVHRSMVDGCALLDLDVEFIPDQRGMTICSTIVEPKEVDRILSTAEEKPIGVYLTSPDYLGGQSDIRHIASVCHRYKVPLLVDNAHGSYLAFLEESQHPIALGADLCCDSAHKTLPVLTGGAYLHLSPDSKKHYASFVNKAMTLFGSTSPSYLILQSLDLCNRYLSEGYRQRLQHCINEVKIIQEEMIHFGLCLLQGEPLKIVIDASSSGYTGYEISQEMREFITATHRMGIECEYADYQYVVLMVSPENENDDFTCLRQWMKETRLRQKKELSVKSVASLQKAVRRMSIRQAVLSDSVMIPVSEAVGRILAQETISCPPAIPIGISGEEVTKEMAELFLHYGIDEISVVSCNV